MNKLNVSIGVIFIFLISLSVWWLSPSTGENILSEEIEREDEGIEAKRRLWKDRASWEFKLQRNPETGEIPKGIKAEEVRLAKRVKEYEIPNAATRNDANITITGRGPNNRGGRTRALAFDSRNASIMLAGGISSGMFKSTNGGTSWTRVSSTSEIHNVTCIAQDPNTPDTWYFGTGEALGNSADGQQAPYLGHGIWKSTDNGDSWSALSSTQAGLQTFDSGFDYVNSVVVDASGNVLAAITDAIYRSTNGGTSWTNVLGDENNKENTDIIYTGSAFYAAFDGTSSHEGVWQSFTGAASSWTQIAGNISGTTTPATWKTANNYGRVVLAHAPNNSDIVFALYDNKHENQDSDCGTANEKPEADLFKYDDNAGTWTDLSANLPNTAGAGNCTSGNDPFAIQGGYDLVIGVKPNDENTIFIGGTSLFRSTDGFTTTSNTTRIGGYATADGYADYANHHPDVHELVFAPSDNDNLYTGSDGGVHKGDITAGTVSWTALNTDYVTYQFYYADLVPQTGGTAVVGGAQDNGCVEAGSGTSFNEVVGGDGVAVGAISYTNASSYNYIVATQNGNVSRATAPNTSFDIKPAGSTSEFGTYFQLDQDNTNHMYYASKTTLVRTRMAESISATTVTGNSATGWENLTGVSTTGNITAMATSRNNSYSNAAYSASDNNRKLYIGTDGGKLYRLDDPAFGSASNSPTDITPSGVAATSVITSVATNPKDDKEVLVVLSNYGIVNIYHTTDATVASPTWTAVEGSTAAVQVASIRSCAIAVNGNNKLYFIGTSVGVFCAPTMNGASTAWSRVGSTNIGFALASSMRYRPSDFKLLIGTHGNGMFELDLTTALPVELTSFTGEAISEGNELTWTTALEENNSGFDIEKSLDGKTFEKIDFISGNGTTVNENTYQFLDREVTSSINYYRLKQIDYDESFEYSNVIVIKSDLTSRTPSVKLYPNPTKGAFTIDLSDITTETLNVQIVDETGKLVRTLNLNPKTSQHRLDQLGLAKGIYFVTIKTDNYSKTIKLVQL